MFLLPSGVRINETHIIAYEKHGKENDEVSIHLPNTVLFIKQCNEKATDILLAELDIITDITITLSKKIEEIKQIRFIQWEGKI